MNWINRIKFALKIGYTIYKLTNFAISYAEEFDRKKDLKEKLKSLGIQSK